jgi:hypothetical protein
MGAFSTLNVSRKAALAKLAELTFGYLDNPQLEELLNRQFHGQLRNFNVRSNEGADDEEFEYL